MGAALLGCATGTPPQTSSAEFDQSAFPTIIVTRIAPGDEFVLSISRTESDEPARAVRTIDVRIEEQLQDGWRISWTTREVELDGVSRQVRNDPFLRKLLTREEGQRVEFVADHSLTPTRVLNIDEIVAFRELQMNEMLGMLARRADSADPISAAIAPALERLNRREIAEAETLANAQTFFMFCFAETYQLPIEARGLIQNPFGADPIPARTLFTLDSWDVAAMEATLRYVVEPDPARSARLMRGSMSGLIAGLPVDARAKAVAALEGIATVDIRETVVAVMDLSDGIARSIEWERSVRAVDQERITRTTIRRK